MYTKTKNNSKAKQIIIIIIEKQIWEKLGSENGGTNWGRIVATQWIKENN